MADRARLEIVCARKRTVGSNPTLSAIFVGAMGSEKWEVGQRIEAVARLNALA